eukprot:8588870-Karenia_brevis.AAC.1
MPLWPIVGNVGPSMTDRQTVPGADMVAVIRACLAVEQYGLGVTGVTMWSDSKILVDGYRKGEATLQSVS